MPMGLSSVILDKGNEKMIIYKDKEVRDADGMLVVYPDYDNPVEIRVTSSEERGSIAELQGQVHIPQVRFITRFAEIGSYAVAEYAGDKWNLSVPPRATKGLRNGFAQRGQHIQFTLRSRNQSPDTVQYG